MARGGPPGALSAPLEVAEMPSIVRGAVVTGAHMAEPHTDTARAPSGRLSN